MPTILNERGFRFMIYTEDHPPAHVHVSRQGHRVAISFENEIFHRSNTGLSYRDLNIAIRIVRDNRDRFLEEWRKIHG